MFCKLQWAVIELPRYTAAKLFATCKMSFCSAECTHLVCKAFAGDTKSEQQMNAANAGVGPKAGLPLASDA